MLCRKFKESDYEPFAEILTDTEHKTGIVAGYCEKESYPYGTWNLYAGHIFTGEYYKTKEEAIASMLRRANIDLDE